MYIVKQKTKEILRGFYKKMSLIYKISKNRNLMEAIFNKFHHQAFPGITQGPTTNLGPIHIKLDDIFLKQMTFFLEKNPKIFGI